jgi:hypothetical protein
MKPVSIRIDENVEKFFQQIDPKPTTAANTVIEIYTWLHRATCNELRGRFTREEIMALANSFKGLMPTWQLMVNPAVLVTHTEDAERYQYSASMYNTDPVALIQKLKVLTSAQATVLQLELVNFWNHPMESNTDNFDNLFRTLAPIESTPIDKTTATHFRDK